MMITPMITCVQYCETFSRTRPSLIVTVIKTPPSVPISEPRPPVNDVPPMITPATTGSRSLAP